MTRLIYDDLLYWILKCENCNGKMYLPGIVPSAKMLAQCEWNYCPHCGARIDYDKTIAVIREKEKQNGRLGEG